MTNCCGTKEWGQYIVEGCSGGNRIDQIVSYKLLRPEERFFEYTSDYITFSEIQPIGWAPGECGGSGYDYEKILLCEVGTGEKVLVESWVDTSDPTQTRNTRYTYLTTNLPFTGNPNTQLTSCSDAGENIDIQTKQYCDNGETIFGTLVFDVSNGLSLPSLLGIVFHKTDGTIHIPTNPIEGSCSVGIASYNNVKHDIVSGGSLSIPGNTVHSISYQIFGGDADIEIGGNTITYPNGSTGSDEATGLINQTYTFTSGAGVNIIIKTIY